MELSAKIQGCPARPVPRTNDDSRTETAEGNGLIQRRRVAGEFKNKIGFALWRLIVNNPVWIADISPGSPGRVPFVRRLPGTFGV